MIMTVSLLNLTKLRQKKENNSYDFSLTIFKAYQP